LVLPVMDLDLKLPRRPTLTLEKDEVVVYDPYSRQLTKDKVDVVDASKEYTRRDIPRWGKRVDIYLDIGPADDKTNRFLATFNLKSLGFSMNMRRHFGELKCIYVLNKGPGPQPQSREMEDVI